MRRHGEGSGSRLPVILRTQPIEAPAATRSVFGGHGTDQEAAIPPDSTPAGDGSAARNHRTSTVDAEALPCRRAKHAPPQSTNPVRPFAIESARSNASSPLQHCDFNLQYDLRQSQGAGEAPTARQGRSRRIPA